MLGDASKFDFEKFYIDAKSFNLSKEIIMENVDLKFAGIDRLIDYFRYKNKKKK